MIVHRSHGVRAAIPVLRAIAMVSFWEKLEQAEREAAQPEPDPLRVLVERTVRGIEAISTAALLDLIGLPNTTCNARRVSKVMQSLGYVPMKSRRFLPGGFRGTVTRGWTRPFRHDRPEGLNDETVSDRHRDTQRTGEKCHAV
jgi:hypothetical protein